MSYKNQKVLLFIVEGKNDIKEVRAILRSSRFKEELEKYSIQFTSFDGDVSSRNNVTIKNIQNTVTQLVHKFRKNNPFRFEDYKEIIQIVDLDGTFIPDYCVIKGESRDYQYTSEFIITSDVRGAQERNRQKSSNLRKLITVAKIDNIPFSIYFVSRNMEHVLFNETGSPSMATKRDMADSFSDKCDLNPDILDDSLFNKEICSTKPYVESWEDVQTECRSLERHTNFNLFFSKDAKNPK